MKKIKLTQGQVALVDDADVEMLSKFKWSARWCPDTKSYYAIATVSMGRLILGLRDPKIKADHINHTTLDNQRHNLRPATHTQNKRNMRGVYLNSKSGHRGVGYHRQSKKWHARIRVNGKLHSLGLFKKIGDAVAAYAAANRHHFGEFGGLR